MTTVLSILSVLLLLAGCGYGKPQMHSPAADTTAAPKPFIIGDPLASASNGSTLQEILQEISTSGKNERSRRQTNGCFFSAGTYGGGGGNAFNELLDNCGAVIKRITIRAWSYIDAIQITYRLSNGQDYTAGFHGGYGGARHVIDIDITNEEKIIGIFGRSASYVDRLGFITNKGRIFGPYGGCGGRSFNVDSCHIRGIYGRSASYLDSIGFFCSHI